VPILVEAVCCSVNDCVEATTAGADRIELCAALSMGGLTPSLGTFLEARAGTDVPIVCMLRPRAGGFCYTERELATMRRDADLFRSHGADGIVFGVLTPAKAIDVARCRELIEVAGPLETTFHRAFDVVPDPWSALETLAELGVTRILTSGGERTALEGASLIRRLIERAGNRIGILPGGGIRAHNVMPLLRTTGAQSIHLAPVVAGTDTWTASGTSSFRAGAAPAEGGYSVLDTKALRAIRLAIGGAVNQPAGGAGKFGLDG
jgi:copper homeostasis protein